MNDKELISAVHSSMYHQCQSRGYAAPVDVLMDIGVLPKKKFEEWRYGKVPYLESVCTVNLRKLSFIMSQMRSYAKKSRAETFFLLLQAVGREKGNRAGTQDHSSSEVQQNRTPGY